MLVYYNSRECSVIHLLFALSAAPTGGMFKLPGLNSKYHLFPLQLAGAVCKRHNIGYVMSFQEREVCCLTKVVIQQSSDGITFHGIWLLRWFQNQHWTDGNFASLQATEKWSQFLSSQTSFSLRGAEAWNNVYSSILLYFVSSSTFRSQATFPLSGIYLTRAVQTGVLSSKVQSKNNLVLNCSIYIQVIVVKPGWVEEKGKQRVRILYGFNFTKQLRYWTSATSCAVKRHCF